MRTAGLQALPVPPPRATASQARYTASERLVLGLVLVEWAAVYAPTVRWLLGRWTTSVWQDSHGLLIVIDVGYFVWAELRVLHDLPRSSCAWGFAFLVPALVLRSADTGMHTQLLSAASLVLILPGLSLLFLGQRRTRAIAFPLAFSVFALPIPLTLIAPVHMALRHLATRGAASVIEMVDIPVLVEETTIHVPTASLLIGDACSGFSTIYAAIGVAFLTAYAASGPRRRVVPLLAAVPLAIGANVLRVALLTLLVYMQGTDVLATSLHPLSGILTFVLVLPVIFWLGESPGSGVAEAPAARASRGGAPRAMRMISNRFGLIVAALLGLALVPTVIHDYVGAVSHDGRTTRTIAARLAGLTAESVDQKEGVKDAFFSNDWVDRRYRDGGSTAVSLFVTRSYDYKRLYHHPELSLLHGIDLQEIGSKTFPEESGLVVRLLRPRRDGRPGLAAYSLLYSNQTVGNPYVFQLRTALQLLIGRPKQMTLFFAFDAASPVNTPPENALVVRVVLEAIRSFLGDARSASG